MNEFETIISNIKSIGYFLASKKDASVNEQLKNDNVVSDITDIKLSDLKYNLEKLSKYHIQMEKQSIIRIKICIASSASLKEERNEIETYLSWKNDKLIEQGVYLHYNVWEKQSPRFNHTYKQEDYNEALVFDSEIFVCLIGNNVGKFTQEEFDKAKKRFDEEKKPFVFYVYFQTFEGKDTSFYETEGWQKRVALKKHIETDFNQFHGSFGNKDELIRNIDSYIDQDIDIVKKKLLDTKVIT
jgi:hypothetical protein